MDVGGPEDGCWWAGRWMFVGQRMDAGGPEDGVGWARRWSLVGQMMDVGGPPRAAVSEPSLSFRELTLENGPDELGTSVSLTQTSRC